MAVTIKNKSFADTCESSPSFRLITVEVSVLKDLLQQKPNLRDILLGSYGLQKKAQGFMEYQRPETMVIRSHDKDRVHPLETVALQQFNREHNATIEHAVVHSGPLANEFTRSLNALAVTVGRDIYFRNNAYNPADEEGRKLLAHELTHVAQFNENRVTRQSSSELLEAEAEHAEIQETYDPDPFVTVKTNGKKFSVRASQMKQISRDVAQNIEEWMKDQKYVLDEKEYLELLIAYRDWVREAI